MTVSSTGDTVLTVLAEIAEAPELRDNVDVDLFEGQILNSLRTVEMILALSERFGIEISPAEFDRERWSTPRKIVADIESRLSR